VKRHLREGQYFPFEGIRYVSPKGKTAYAHFQEGPGWGVPRLELSRALLKQASELDCLEIRTEVQATPVDVEGADVHKQMFVRVGKDLIRTRLLIGADGLNSVVRRWANLDGSKGKLQRWGIRQHFQTAPWSQEVEVHWGDGLEAYITPCGENLVGVAFLWDRRRHPHHPGGNRLIPAFLEAFPAVQERLPEAPASDTALAIGPMQRTAIQPIADGVLLIGDAAGYLDALTGEGISLVLAQAISLEETVVPILLASERKEMLSVQDLSAYKQAYDEIIKPYYQVTHLALWLSHHPVLAEQAIDLLGHQPALFQSLLSANMGLLPLWKVAIAGKFHVWK
jgi:flavin-dependent dehydrogenase